MATFFEFFAGGGMARAGLGKDWKCLFANDFDFKKAAAYRQNWGDVGLKVEDVSRLTSADLPGFADVAWASFPCQDLSLAGGGAGLKGERSGTFKPFWKLMLQLVSEGRQPKAVVLENVCGAITSHDGKDFETLCVSLASAGYLVGALVIDAARFLPQSRPRLFIVGVRDDVSIPREIKDPPYLGEWHTPSLMKAYDHLPDWVKARWIWWNLPIPVKREKSISDVIEDVPEKGEWLSDAQTAKLLEMMTPLNRAKVSKALMLKTKVIGSIYKRTRTNGPNGKVQRAEVRFDGISGCLRTPSGGSSRQLIIIVEDGRVGVRLISARETARLMGLPDTYVLPENYNEAYHLTGDGVAVPVVAHIAKHILEPLVSSAEDSMEEAA